MILESFQVIHAGIETIAIVGLSLAAASTVAQTVTSSIASAQSAKAEKARQQQIQLRDRRERARVAREQQREAARIRASSIASGVEAGTASSVEAGITDTASQLNRNLAFLQQDTGLSLSGSRSLADARRFESFGNIAEGVGQIGSLAAGSASRISRLFASRPTG